MQSDTSRDDIFSQLTEQWLPGLHQGLKELLLSDVRRYRELLETARGSAENGDEVKAVRQFAEKFAGISTKEDTDEQSGDKHQVPDWLQKVQEATADIAAEVILEQQEQRFMPEADDTLIITAGKTVKRIARSVGNVTGKIAGKSSEEPSVWHQKIPLKNLVERHLTEYGPWVAGYHRALYKAGAGLLLQLDGWMIGSERVFGDDASIEEMESDQSAEITGIDDSLPNIITQAIEDAEKLEKQQLAALEEKSEEIKSRIKKEVAVTGTLEGSAKKYREKQVRQKQRAEVQLQQKSDESWQNLLDNLAGSTLLIVHFLTLHQQTGERIEGFRKSLQEFFEVNLANPLQLIAEELDDTIAIFEDSGDKTIPQIKELAREHREELSKKIEHRLLKPLQELTTEAVMSTRLERFTSAMPEWVNQQPKKAILVQQTDLDMNPPKYEVQQVDWRALVRRVMNNELAQSLVPRNIKFEQFLEEVAEDLRELSQIIYTNLELVNEVKDSDQEEPFEVAREGLERASVQLEEIRYKTDQRKGELAHIIQQRKEEVFVKLGRLIKEQNVGDLRMAGAEYKAREKAVDWQTKIQAVWARLAEHAELFFRFIWKKIRGYYSETRTFLGFQKEESLDRTTTDLATFLAETDEKIEGLPFIYRRLFDFKKEVDDRFYVRQPEQMERLKKGFELWQHGFPSTFGVIGEKGSGKSLFLRIIQEEILGRSEVIDVNFKETVWNPASVNARIAEALGLEEIIETEALIEAINQKEQRTVVMLENVQNCFIRNIEGFEAMEHLLYLVSETNKQILWAVSCTRYGWAYLDKVVNIADYFTHVVQSDNLNANQIEELILKRHRATGYQLVFLPEEATKKSRAYRKLLDDEEKQQEYLQHQFFEKLAKLAEGNSSIAMIYWIRSIKEYDDSFFYINPFQFGNVNRIGELDTNELFALAAFVLHDTLTPAELQKAVHQPLRDSQLIVSRLYSRSILVKVEQGYVLNHLIYRQVIRVLKEANILH